MKDHLVLSQVCPAQVYVVWVDLPYFASGSSFNREESQRVDRAVLGRWCRTVRVK